MADFTAADLLTRAQERYRISVLRARMRGAEGDQTAADAELLRIATAVYSRVSSACMVFVGWPLPGQWPAGSLDDGGNDISGKNYSEVWPFDLLENALQLFNY